MHYRHFLHMKDPMNENESIMSPKARENKAKREEKERAMHVLEIRHSMPQIPRFEIFASISDFNFN